MCCHAARCPSCKLQVPGSEYACCPLLLVPVVCAGRFARRQHVRAVRSFGCVATQLRLQTARSCSGFEPGVHRTSRLHASAGLLGLGRCGLAQKEDCDAHDTEQHGGGDDPGVVHAQARSPRARGGTVRGGRIWSVGVRKTDFFQLRGKSTVLWAVWALHSASQWSRVSISCSGPAARPC